LQHYANQLLIEVAISITNSDKLSRSRSYNDLYLDVTFWDMGSNISMTWQILLNYLSTIQIKKNKFFFFTEHTIVIGVHLLNDEKIT